MTEQSWRYRNKMRCGVLIEWVSELLAGGCSLISIQCMWESHESRFPRGHNQEARQPAKQGRVMTPQIPLGGPHHAWH
jgi:hypothetical protein